MNDSYHSTQTAPALAPAIQAAAVNGVAVDVRGYGSALIARNTGAIVGAGDFGAKLQESDQSASGFTDVAAADQLGSFPATLAADSAYRVGYAGRKRYIRLAVSKAGGTSVAAGAVAVLGQPAETKA